MSPYPAIHRNGACTGSLWKSHSRKGIGNLTHDFRSLGASAVDLEGTFSLDGIFAEANQRQRTHEFCVLVGNTLWSYSDVWAYAKGDPPTSEIRIVGASAWNPPSVTKIPGSLKKSVTLTTSSSTNSSLASEAISTASISSKSSDFLIVTYSGTHVRCSAPTSIDKDKWLAALHAGLEGNIMENRVETLVVLSKQPKELSTETSRRQSDRETRLKCREHRSCIKSDMMVQSAIGLAMISFEAEMSFQSFVPPLPRVDVRHSNEGKMNKYPSNQMSGEHCSVSSIYGVGSLSTDPTYCLPSTGYHSPCDDWPATLSNTHCTACGQYPPDHAMRIDAAPLPEYGMEVRVDLCHDCWIAQGVLGHVRYLGWLYEVEARDRAAIRMAWVEVQVVLERLVWENDGLKRTNIDPKLPGAHSIGEGRKISAQLANPKLDGTTERVLLELVSNESFVAYRQRSTILDSVCQALEMQGMGSASDFLENIKECAQAAESSCLRGGDKERAGNRKGIARPREKICLKKEAFKVAGDMSAALKLLYEYALPPEHKKLPVKTKHSHLRDNAVMLAAILEFFLDLCDEGQMDAVAFFWPQLCHIHMQMLPPKDIEEMIRVELMEDFLLTVATRYSVHLALNLVWGLTADLEESLGSLNCSSLSRSRRFAIVRFVSELESLLFDFEGGWGGGGVSLHGMLSPSQHQAALLRDSMSLLQLRRRFGSHYLTRSVRLDKLRAEAVQPLKISPSANENIVMAQIAKNAAYFSSHINFARKLGDIAEKLRFISLEQRPETLRRELKEINASGKRLGGDPLNRLCVDGQFQNAVHVPFNEGHVFRSKERTPVLLLVEVVKDHQDATHIITEEDSNRWSGKLFLAQDKHEPQSVSSCSPNPTCLNLDENIEDRVFSHLSCPESPSPAQQALHSTLSHRLLALTPRASEATNVTEEGKEMMADMIATLIVNQKNNLLAGCNTEDANKYGGTSEPHQSSKAVKSSLSVKPSRSLHHAIPSEIDDPKRISALGSVFPQGHANLSADFSSSAGIHLTADGQFRRDVLFAIMERGMRGSNVIAKGAATAARRAIQAMDRKRAIALMNEPIIDTEDTRNDVPDEGSPGYDGFVSSDITINASIDEGEVLEALRLLIIQNQVAQENLSPGNAVKSNGTPSHMSLNGVDAGEVDHRLAGCGHISSSILSALRLWKGGIVSNGELLELVQKDLQFLKQSAAFGSTDEKKLIEDSAFWGRFSFGERWAEKKARLAASSPYGSLPEWNLIGCIVKSNDDLRQEAFVMQLIGLCDEAFRTAGLDLWVHPYNIVATGLSTGIIECVRNAMSFDSLKKRPGYGSDGLAGHFERMTEIAADPRKALSDAKQNFVSSLAAYSLMSYLFMFKDRHNGNLLLDTAGHVIHIDFGFVFGIAPGGSFSLEQSTPFKLTDEMLEVMGGLGSPLFSEFVTLFCCGFLALQAHADTFLTVVEVTCKGSNFHCFNGKDPVEIVTKLRERFCPELSKSKTVAYALDLIKFATTSYGTKQYDYFQYLSQGIAT